MIESIIIALVALVLGCAGGYALFRYVVKGKYKELKKENAELYSMVDEKDKQVENLKAQITQAQNDYNSLKMAKMLEITDGDMESAQKRLQKLIRDVNKCITLLSEK